MRLESVASIAFGPFKSVSLEFAPQLTVIYGPNEAGKSTWHAAIYASLCGMRRGKGQLKKDRDFAELRRPWSGDSWEVRAIIRLDNGRRVELRQNLTDLAHCSATDADLGRDLAGEILNEGTPDAAKWLGLDRESFLSVACVRQAEVQSVTESAGSLQDELQRAAASAARDATAAEAIARMEDFHREQVGQERANSTKPLQRAKVRVTAAEVAVAAAEEKHGRWLAIEAQALELRKTADEQERKLRMLRALRAEKEAALWRAKLERARALAAKYPQGKPALLSDSDALAEDVASALALWQNRPEVRNLTGSSSAEIRAEIDALPPMPSGDQVPRAEVVAAMKAYDRALREFELHEALRPADFRPVDAKGLTADQLRGLATALEMMAPPIDSGLEAAHRELRARVEQIQRSWVPRPVIAGVAVAGVLGGAGASTFWNIWIGGALLIFGVLAFIWLLIRSGDASRAHALEALLKVEAQVLMQRKAADDVQAKMNSAQAQIAELGLPATSAALRELADGLVLTERHRQVEADWSKRHEELRSDIAGVSETAAQGLRSSGVVDTRDLPAAFQEYERACRSNKEQAIRAVSREPLNQQLSDREAAEKTVLDAQSQRFTAAEKIVATLARCGVESRDPEKGAEELLRWQLDRKAVLTKFDDATREYAELNAILDGATLEDLETRTSECQRQAAALAAELDAMPEFPVDADLDREISANERLALDASNAITAADTLARERAREVPNVSEAEEALASAQQELERVTRLGRTLTLTLDFLRKAEERVHRDIAPVLAAGLRRWLPGVTHARYTDARVDPRDLAVQVLGPDNEWRDARHLSHGTAEQIYLLLRVVLAERLATTGETCPLILDDVLVQSDRERKRALLDVIASISRERQVILLTQEEEVLRWAQASLVAPDRVLVLPGP